MMGKRLRRPVAESGVVSDAMAAMTMSNHAEHQKPYPPGAVKERTCNRAYAQAGNNAEEGRQAGKRRRAVGRQREQHYRDAYHRLPDAGNLHTEKERDDGRDFQQRTIGTIERSRALD